jgi:hypothetical protein
MKPKTPFKRPATSQHCTAPFYWRGGDVLREREYVTDEYRKALADLQVAEQTLRTVEADVEVATEKLNERDGYTTALAGFLDGDTEGFTTENQLKRELIQLEHDITHNEIILRKRRAVHNPGIASALQKEKAYYQIDIERHIKAIENFDDDKRRAKETIAGTAVSKQYATALQAEFQLDKVQRKKRFLRSLVNHVKYDFDSTKPQTAGQSPDARSQRLAMQDGLELIMEIHRAEEKLDRRPPKYANQLHFVIEQIEDLNTKMIEIGMDEDTVDTQELRERMLRPREPRVREEPPPSPPRSETKSKPSPSPSQKGRVKQPIRQRKPREERKTDTTPRRTTGQEQPETPQGLFGATSEDRVFHRDREPEPPSEPVVPDVIAGALKPPNDEPDPPEAEPQSEPPPDAEGAGENEQPQDEGPAPEAD